jgi:hypothetical protein
MIFQFPFSLKIQTNLIVIKFQKKRFQTQENQKNKCFLMNLPIEKVKRLLNNPISQFMINSIR